MAKFDIPTIERRMSTDAITRDIQDGVRDSVGSEVFGFAPTASGRWASGDRGQQAVDIAERMRAAARFSDLEGNMMKNKVERSIMESAPEFTGAKQQPEQLSGNIFDAARKTIDWEGRKDQQGNLSVYKLPSGDMGGSYEVAGINDRYHPEAARALRDMAPEKRRDYAANYIVKYTAPLVSRMPDKLQPFVQDLAFNRGMGGATIYLQQALNNLGQNVSVDGGMGPKTLQAINSVNPTELMREASKAQLLDEKRRAEQNPERRKFLNGLENRITNRFGAFGSV
tara:strand:+ start:202 stop:1050 length:849 start_codon:yes stop_codon:yes gene_type:complete